MWAWVVGVGCGYGMWTRVVGMGCRCALGCLVGMCRPWAVRLWVRSWLPHRSRNVRCIAVSQVSARGLDFAVLLGAERTLALTHFLWFECSRHMPHSLKPAIDFLDGLGFYVFKVAHAGLHKLYGPYWDDVHDVKRGSHNCFGIRKGSPFLAGVPMICPHL